MTDAEVGLKLAFLAAGILGIIALGYVMVFVIAPVFLVAALIDFGMRQSYNVKLSQVQNSAELVEEPKIHSFDARLVEGEVLIGWLVDLPRDGQLDIFRVQGHGAGSIADLSERGHCIHSTRVELTETREHLFVDVGLEDGTYYYVPVVHGAVIEKEPLEYSFFDFAREVQYRVRRSRRHGRGEAVAVVVKQEVVEQLPDLRDAPARIADDVMAQIQLRRKFDADLDAAIGRIKSNEDLSEHEKQEAIELLETRATVT